MSATLTTTEIMQKTLDAFKVQVPLSNLFATDFSSETSALNQTIKAHIDVVPTVSSWNSSTGYANGAQEADDLLVDMPILLDQHAFVTASLLHIDAISQNVDKLNRAIGNQAYALGKAIFDAAMAKCVAANLTYTVTKAAADTDSDTLRSIGATLNANGAMPNGRFGIVNSDVATALFGDSRLTSKEFAGQTQGGNGYLWFKNVAGFENIVEYPGLPSTGNRSGVFGDRRAVAIATRVPDRSSKVAAQYGIPSVGAFETVSDPETGLTLLGIKWQAPGTFDVRLTMAILYGVVVGAQGGSAGDIADKAGLRLITA